MMSNTPAPRRRKGVLMRCARCRAFAEQALTLCRTNRTGDAMTIGGKPSGAVFIIRRSPSGYRVKPYFLATGDIFNRMVRSKMPNKSAPSWCRCAYCRRNCGERRYRWQRAVCNKCRTRWPIPASYSRTLRRFLDDTASVHHDDHQRYRAIILFCATFFRWGIWRVIRHAVVSDTTRLLFAKTSLCKTS